MLNEDEARNGTEQQQQSQALEPVEQESIVFHDQTIIAVRLADGRICVVLRWVCESLSLQPGGQVRKIERTASTASELVRVRVQTRGGKQTMPAITLKGFPVWMLTISPSEIKEEYRDLIAAYQTEAKDVLYEHFINRSRPQPGQARLEAKARIPTVREIPAVIPSEPIKPDLEPSPEATDEELTTYHEAMALWHRWKADQHAQKWRGQVIAWQGTVESRIESMEEVVRSVLPKLGLSPEHQASTRAMIEELWKLTGTPRQALYYELNQAFRVAKYDNIPDDQWIQVTRWLKKRINAAKGQG